MSSWMHACTLAGNHLPPTRALWPFSILLLLVLQLHIAVANGYRQVLQLLLENGADVNAANDSGWTPLHVASKFAQVRIVAPDLKSWGGDHHWHQGSIYSGFGTHQI